MELSAEGAASGSGEKKAAKGSKEKKPGFLQKIIGALFDSSDDDEDEENANHTEATLENMQVIKEAEAEEDSKKKKKKEKKPKPKKEKKPKPKKPKKERKPVDDGPPEKKIPRKKILAVVIFFASLTAMILFCLSIFPKAGYIKEGTAQYQRGDYDNAFRSMAGLKGLDEESQEIFDNTVTIMSLKQKLESFEDYDKQGKNLEALNALIEGVAYYEAHIDEAREKGIDGDFTEIYDKIMATLSEKFGVGNQRAAELSYISDRTTYTIALMDIADPEWRDRVREEIISDELAALGVDTTSNYEKNKKRVVSTSVESYDPRAIPVEEAAPPSDNPEGDLAADTGETSEAGGDNPEPAESEDEEDNDESEDEGYEGGSSDEGDLLYEFNVSRQRDGTYSSR
ncbi:MAG: hypothetical protein IJT63_06395 [Lachnospiraceae bacterium]|nr:hypothetical protein [Lachnospiraceae bacterium]